VSSSHNHPSGNLDPSNADRKITTKIRKALKLFEIDLIDHVASKQKLLCHTLITSRILRKPLFQGYQKTHRTQMLSFLKDWQQI
jgi:hypothetical protein